MQPALALPAPPSGNDFADWLSPILVKELRQGLKSRAFVVTFIIVQVVMILLVGMQLLALAGGGGRGTIEGFDFFFWLFVWVPLLVMMPARGLMAVSEEVKANTLDLVQLTRLTAFRIVLGKWVALVSQTMLLVAAILPYAVLRYFFGEVDVVADLQIIALLLMASLCLTACMIALSSVQLAVRIIMLLLLLVFLIGMAAVSGFTDISEWSWELPAMVGIYTYLLLEIAAGRIAPISENHAAPKRLLCLGLGLAGLFITGLADQETSTFWMAAASLPCAWIVLEALCERTVTVPSLYGSFARRGILGRLMGRVLYPGWASGLVFCGLLTVMQAAAVWLAVMQHPILWEEDPQKMALLLPISFASAISPVVVLLLFPRLKQPMWLYVLVQAVCALLYLIAAIVDGNTVDSTGEAYRWLALFPTSTLFALLNESHHEGLLSFFTTVSIPVCAVITGCLAWRAVQEFRLIGNLERQCLAEKPAP